MSRHFLDHLLGSQFVIQYLGGFTASKQALKITVPFAAIGVLDMTRDFASTYKTSMESYWCTENYKQLYGMDTVTCHDKVKDRHLKKLAGIGANNPGGLVRTFGRYMHQLELFTKISDILLDKSK